MESVGQSVPASARVGADVLGVVLAAGAGSRYGMPKILAQQGEWLRLAVHALLGGGCDEVVVAMGARVVDAPPGSSALVVPDWAEGLSATVAAALRFARGDPDRAGVVLHVVDTPDVGPEVVGRVLAAAGGQRDRLVRATFDGRPGHPVYVGAEHFTGVLAAVGGDTGAHAYLGKRDDVLAIECGDLATGRDDDGAGHGPRGY